MIEEIKYTSCIPKFKTCNKMRNIICLSPNLVTYHPKLHSEHMPPNCYTLHLTGYCLTLSYILRTPNITSNTLHLPCNMMYWRNLSFEYFIFRLNRSISLYVVCLSNLYLIPSGIIVKYIHSPVSSKMAMILESQIKKLIVQRTSVPLATVRLSYFHIRRRSLENIKKFIWKILNSRARICRKRSRYTKKCF